MKRYELAEEFALTDQAAAALCNRLAIPTSSPDDEIADADAERFRLAARADLSLGTNDPSTPSPAEGPFAAPGQVGQAPGPGEDVAAGWAAPEPTGAWAPGTNGHGEHDQPSGRPGPGPQYTEGGAPSWARSADLARLDAARSKANSYTTSGYALLALGLAITIGTLALAPGGFFIVSFGTVFVGFRRLRAGRMMRAQIRAVEQQLGPDPGPG
jgi:hypothetical protein